MAFLFEEPVDPKNPLSMIDPPPSGWKDVNTHDYSKALFVFRPAIFTECIEWEKRELARIQKNKVSARTRSRATKK